MSERATMPVVNARRSPRNANWRGRKPSRARNEERRGKSAKLVFAARTRMSAVATWATTRTQPSPVRCPDQEAEDRVCSSGSGLDPERRQQVGDPEEQHGEHDGRPGQRRPRVLPLRRLEGRHAVADRLDAGQRHGALAERTQDEEQAERLGSLLDRAPMRPAPRTAATSPRSVRTTP